MKMFRVNTLNTTGGSVLVPTFMVLIMLLSTIVPLGGTAVSIPGDDASRSINDTAIGEWSQLSSGGWPSTIDTNDCRIIQKPGEMLVFNNDDDEFEVWSYFTGNETWVLWNTSGTPPSPGVDNRAFTSSDDGNEAYFYGGNSGYSYLDDFNVFFYHNLTWVEYDTPSTLGDRYRSSMVYDDSTDSVWLFGGRERLGGWDRPFRSDLHKFNTVDGWTLMEPDNEPDARDQALITIDDDDENIYIALGRYATQGYSNYYTHDLWVYDISRNNWTELNEDTNIRTDAGGIMQYRSLTDDLILTLGFDGNDLLNDTFIIDTITGNATQVNLTGGIPDRSVWGWDLLEDGNKIIIFGDSEGTKDIWEIDINEVSSTLMEGGPSWSGGNSFVGYDPDDGGKLMALKYVGGTYWQLVYFSLADKEWVFLEASQENTPPAYSRMSYVYDHINDIFYLYGGYTRYRISQYQYHYTYYDEFWKLDCNTGEWTRIMEHAPPGPRAAAAFGFDPIRNELTLFGGMITSSETHSLAYYNVTNNLWTTTNLQIHPSARIRSSMVFDEARDGFFMFGGQENSSNNPIRYNDLWFFHSDTKRWEQMPNNDPPEMQSDAGLSMDTDNNELMLFGDRDEGKVMVWRQEWNGWRAIEPDYSPWGWSGHGQAYSEEAGTHFIWAGRGTEVWEYNPVKWTPAIQIRILDPDGEYSGTSAIPVFPTMGTYTLKVVGKNDLPEDDMTGIAINLTIGEEKAEIEYHKNGNQFSYRGNESWFLFPDDPYFEYPEENEWEFNVPIEFTFDIPHDVVVKARSYPITTMGEPEVAQRASLFRMVSDINIVSYDFSTDLQENPLIGGWLFGRTNLTISDFRIAFRGYPNTYPQTGGIQASLDNGKGGIDVWDYVYNTSSELSVQIMGSDNEVVKFYLNLTADSYLIDSLIFQFKLDLDPPSSIIGAAVRADSAIDDTIGYDNDIDVWISWDSVVETGSGLKGICYSLDDNLWPAEENLTTEPETIRIFDEGEHIVYMWAVDNIGRVGPYVEAPIVIDTHHVLFKDYSPVERINSTQKTHTFSVAVTDEISGVDHSSIYYQKSLPDRSMSEWIKYDIQNGSSKIVNLSVTLDLVPGIVNIVIFKANDIADNGEWNSNTFIVRYDPNLVVPLVQLEEPIDGSQIKGKINLAWKGDYIEPDELSYEVHVIAPDGEDRTFEVQGKSMYFTPDIPGEYRWYVVGKAGEVTNSSLEFTFNFQLDMAVIDLPSLTIIEKDSPAVIDVKAENPLDIDMNITVSLDNGRGFSIEGDDTFFVDAGKTVKHEMVLNSTDVQIGTHTLLVNITDEFGRFQVLEMKIRVDAKSGDGGGDDEDGGLSTLTLIIIAVGIIILLALLLMVFLIIRSKKKESDLDKAPDTFQCKHCGKEISEDDESCPHCGMMFSDGSIKDGEYNPEGVVKKKGQGIEVAVPMAPGMLEGGEMNREQSNVLEIEVPAAAGAETVEGDVNLQDEPQQEADEEE